MLVYPEGVHTTGCFCLSDACGSKNVGPWAVAQRAVGGSNVSLMFSSFALKSISVFHVLNAQQQPICWTPSSRGKSTWSGCLSQSNFYTISLGYICTTAFPFFKERFTKRKSKLSKIECPSTQPRNTDHVTVHLAQTGNALFLSFFFLLFHFSPHLTHWSCYV